MTVVIYMTGLGGVNVSERTVIELLLLHLGVVGRVPMFEMHKKTCFIKLMGVFYLSLLPGFIICVVILGFVAHHLQSRGKESTRLGKTKFLRRHLL